ncbi:MAG: delta-60 repeat domain-containing protein, partial [Planctomycetota bacterium]
APSARRLAIALAACVPAAALDAQCNTVLLPGGGVLGADSNVYAAAAWDPDGAGPLGTCLVVGGQFTMLANALGNPVLFDPIARTWSALPGLQPTWISCFCSRPNGELVAGGLWVGSSMLARWNGTVWTPIAPALTQEVRRVVARGVRLVASTYYAVYDVDVATGSFTSILPSPAQALLTLANGDVLLGLVGSILRWDGSAVLPFATTNGVVSSLTTLPSGGVLASGDFTVIGGVAAGRLARWDGTAWHAVAPGVSTWVRAEPMPDGSIVVTGPFTAIGGVPANYIARWNGASWSSLGAGLNGLAAGLAALPSGDLFAIGNTFNTAGGATTSGIAHHDGTAWQRVGGGGPNGRTTDVVQLPDGDVVATGYFNEVGGTPALHAARRLDGQWSPMGSLALTPMAVICGPSGRVFVGGYSDVARWDGTQWLSTNLAPNPNGYVLALAELANGHVVAGGWFTAAGGSAALNIASWNGTTWSPLGPGLAARVTSIVPMPDGTVFAAARQVYRWDGNTWTQLGSIAAGVSVSGATRLCAHPDGRLWATGELTPGAVAQWNGAAWSAMPGQPNHGGNRMAILPDGDVVVFGTSYTYPYLPVGSRWNGAAWSPLAFTFQLSPVSGFEAIEEIEWLRFGELVAVGYFNVVNGQVAPWIASLGTTCPATTTKYGVGCSGSAGPVQLTVVEPAWVGGNLRAITTGIPSGAFAIGIGGLAANQVPLSSILPTGLPGCDLLTTVEALYLLAPVGGSAQSTIPIPNAPLYLGKQFFHQVVVLELGPAGALGPLTGSNAIEVHVGAF